MDKRKIKCLFFSLSFCVRFLSLFFYFPSCVSFFLSTFLFIYFDAYENFPSVSENFHLFSVFKLLIKIFPYQPKFPPEPLSCIGTFSAPLKQASFLQQSSEKKSQCIHLILLIYYFTLLYFLRALLIFSMLLEINY